MPDSTAGGVPKNLPLQSHYTSGWVSSLLTH